MRTRRKLKQSIRIVTVREAEQSDEVYSRAR